MRWVVAIVAGVLLALLVGWIGLNTLTAEDPVPGAVDRSEPPETVLDTVGLPEQVAATRTQLLEAAEAGDHDRLAELAADDFSYTFGAPREGGPAEYWRDLEAQGEEPLEVLAAILRLPYALAGGLYVWPFVHATDPAALTDYERGLLERIPAGAVVGEEGYLGWRAGIAPDGAWRFFVAGD
jgi:hypothetical protein